MFSNLYQPNTHRFTVNVCKALSNKVLDEEDGSVPFLNGPDSVCPVKGVVVGTDCDWGWKVNGNTDELV